MDSQYLRHLLSSAATGSFLLLSASQALAGRLFPDEPSRPHVSAAGAENWGFNQTCWQRFPPIAPCDGGAGCGINPGMAFPGFEPSAATYSPQPGMIVPNQYSPPMPSSSFPQGSGGMRYAPAPSMDSSFGNSRDSQLVLPSSPGLQMPQSFPTSDSTMPQGSPMPMPVPLPASALPPLPSPPTIVPAIPDQSSALPNRLMFDPDGRITAVPQHQSPIQQPSMHSVSTSSRYGQPMNVKPSVAMPLAVMPSVAMPATPTQLPFQSALASNGTSYRSNGVPVQFANRTDNSTPASQTASRYGQSSQAAMSSTNLTKPIRQPGIPAQTISHSRPVSQPPNGIRYGAGRSSQSMPSGNQVPMSGNLEPLRSTPRVPYQR